MKALLPQKSVSSVTLAVIANNGAAKRDGNLCDKSRHAMHYCTHVCALFKKYFFFYNYITFILNIVLIAPCS